MRKAKKKIEDKSKYEKQILLPKEDKRANKKMMVLKFCYFFHVY